MIGALDFPSWGPLPDRMLELFSVVTLVDCPQSPIFPCDRRDRARLTVNGGHLDF